LAQACLPWQLWLWAYSYSSAQTVGKASTRAHGRAGCNTQWHDRLRNLSAPFDNLFDRWRVACDGLDAAPLREPGCRTFPQRP
jgi:hypothetical protein